MIEMMMMMMMLEQMMIVMIAAVAIAMLETVIQVVLIHPQAVAILMLK